MLGPYERAEVCRLVHREFGEMEQMTHNPGSYHYLCETGEGVAFLSHAPVGHVICPVGLPLEDIA